MGNIYKHPTYKLSLPDCYIFDIDGTLAHMQNHRGPFEWDKVHLDEVDDLMLALLNQLRRGNKIIIISGRDECCRELTFKWLNNNNIIYDLLFMRSANDNRKDSIIKEEIYNKHIKDKYNVLGIFDDRQQVVDMWRSLGLKCFQVEPGNF